MITDLISFKTFFKNLITTNPGWGILGVEFFDWFRVVDDQKVFENLKYPALIIEEPDEERLLDRAVREWRLGSDQARAVVDAPIPDGYVRLGRTALSLIVPILRDEPDPEAPAHPIRYWKAVELAFDRWQNVRNEYQREYLQRTGRWRWYHKLMPATG